MHPSLIPPICYTALTPYPPATPCRCSDFSSLVDETSFCRAKAMLCYPVKHRMGKIIAVIQVRLALYRPLSPLHPSSPPPYLILLSRTVTLSPYRLRTKLKTLQKSGARAKATPITANYSTTPTRIYSVPAVLKSVSTRVLCFVGVLAQASKAACPTPVPVLCRPCAGAPGP